MSGEAGLFCQIERGTELMGIAKMRGLRRNVCWILGALCIASASYGQDTTTQGYPRSMMTQEAQDYAHVLGMIKPGQAYTLNLADPAQLRFVQDQLAAAGRTRQTAPQTLASFAASAQKAKLVAAAANGGAAALAARPLVASVAGGPQDIDTITNFGDEGNNTLTATGYSSVQGGTTQTTITTQLINIQTKQVYASQPGTQYAQGTNFQVPVTGKIPAGTNLADVAAVATINTTVGSVSSSVVVSTASMVPATTGTMTAPNYCKRTKPGDPSSDCVIVGGVTQYETGSTTLVPNPPPIKVCFNRGSQQSCDYYNKTDRPATSVFFPAAGTANFGSTTIDSSYLTAGKYTATLIDTQDGGGCSFEGGMGPGWSLANPTTLQWALPQLSITNPGPCLNRYGGRLVNFIFYVVVPVDTNAGKNSGFISFDSAYAPPTPPGYLGFPALFLEDSCVAEGTLVHLADGRDVPIETITADNKPQVVNALGAARTVQGTAKGVEIHPMYRLTTNLGQTLLITRTHPVLTVNGLVMARDIKVGDSVKTLKGVAKITSTAQVNYPGKVYSLRLGWFNETPSENRTHSANGIFIGDSISQQQLEQAEIEHLQHDRSEVLRRLPDDKWRKEYQTFISQSH
jgi:hypothetical protein